MEESSKYSLKSTVSAHDSDISSVIPLNVLDDSFLTGSTDGFVKKWAQESDGSYKECSSFKAPEPVWCLCYVSGCVKYPSGVILAGSCDGNIYAFDINRTEPVFILEAHSDAVCCLTSGMFGIFISGSFDNSAKIWFFDDCYSVLHGHEDAVLAAAFFKKNLVLTGSADCTIRLWNLDKCENVFRGHSSAVTSLLTNSEDNFLSCSCDGNVRMWNSAGQCLRVYDSKSKIYGIVFLQNEEDLAILCEDKIEIVCNFTHFQNVAIASKPLSITCTTNRTVTVGCCSGELHVFQIPEEIKKLHFTNLVEKNEMEKIFHSHSNNQSILLHKEAEMNLKQMYKKRDVFKKKIAIIGAGIAGLSCASRLKELGFTDVKVFEGKKNVGGRIQTLHFGSNYIDMGAQWIHGEGRNSVYEFALKEDLVLKEAPNYMQLLNTFKNLPNKIQYIVVRQLLTFLEEKLDEIVEGPYCDKSVFSYLHYHFSKYISNFDDKFTELLTEAFNWFVNFICEREGCRQLSDVSRSLYNRYEECDGNLTVEVKNGCSSIINLLLKKIPPEWITNNHTVETIDYTEFSTSDISTEATSEGLSDCLDCSPKIKVNFKSGETVLCDHLILTVSVGCLKRKKIAFKPELEHNKQVAIDSIGFHVVNKIYLEFEDIFWKHSSIFNVLWKETYEELFEKSKPEEWNWKICWPKYINRFAYSCGHPKMLTAWIVGEGAECIEKLRDEEISYGCIKLLELILQRNIPKPCQIVRSSWMSDPFICGSYSFLTIENEVHAVYNCDLAKPILSSHVSCQQHPVIQFAGEATHSSFFSTIHGAYETGIREANRLNEHYMKNCDLSLRSCKTVENTFGTKIPRSYLKIVVIGAGLAGLTCGLNLLQKDFADVLILEAQNVVGGRISSMNYGDAVLELGASWLHGSNNPLYTFATKNNLLCNPSDFPSHEGEGVFCTSNGSIVDATIVEEIKEILSNMKSELGISNLRNNDMKSAMEAFSSSFSSYLSDCKQCLNSDVKWALFRWFVKFETIDNGCDNLNDVATQSYTDWEDCCEDMYHINFKTAFQSVVDNLCTQIPSNFVKVSMPVNSLKWNEKFVFRENFFFETEIDREFPILVQCEGGECIFADSVVITASIGFLKDNLDKFFNPTLPLKKLQAIQRLGFGTINKIYLVFAEPFWNDDICGFQLLWLDNLHNDCRKLLNENPWINGISGFDVVRNQPNILLGWIGGVEAKQIENIDDNTVKEVCTKLLRIFLNKNDIPFPKEIFRTYWYTNPYIRGAYSFRSKEFTQFGHSMEDFSPLYCTYTNETGNEFQWPIVIFSGEATDQSAFSSAHGAFQSGLKAFQLLNDACTKIERDLEQNYCNR